MLSDEDLTAYFQLNFHLTQHKTITLTELENMIPWERQVYIDMMIDELERRKREIAQANSS